uniref:chitinase n=1 Tax=Acanthochromis polyacanthus TaxID=80966 RepID=A0A3Q1G6H0_9TELE
MLDAFEKEAAATRRPRLLLAAAVAAGKGNIDNGYEVAAVTKLLDFANVMTYDLHGSWDPFTGHNSPLYGSSADVGEHVYYNVDFAMKYWRDQGAPLEKLLVGFPTYGRTFRTTTGANGVGAPANGPASAGLCETIQCVDLQLALLNNVWILTEGQQHVHSDIPQAKYLKENKFGGAVVWSLDLDDFAGQFCGQGRYPLISYLRSLLNSEDYTTVGPIVTSSASTNHTAGTATTTTTRTTTTAVSGSGFCAGKPNGLYANDKDPRSYYHCSNGITYIKTCSNSLVYDDKCKCCNWA